MKTLLLHPEDSPRRGAWVSQKWDRIIDLGKSSETAAESWQRLAGCPVVRLQAFRQSVDDPRLAGQILRRGAGMLLDEYSIDWWELTSVHLHAEVETAIALGRLAAQADLGGELYATRGEWPVRGLAALLNREIRNFGASDRGTMAKRIGRFARTLGKLRCAQWLEIFWDKYDPGYEWRSRVTRPDAAKSDRVVLVPSSYTNVSRSASEYACMLPEQRFLLVATRNSGLQFECPPNVDVAKLAAYAPARGTNADSILQQWDRVRPHLMEVPELGLLDGTGQFAPFKSWFRAAPAVRDAWRSVLDREPVCGVLCGDDTNWYTRLPVVLARQRNLPTVDFHHGAFDGRFLLKTLPSDVYLAKNEMERDYLTRVCGLSNDRVVVGAPGDSSLMATKPREGRGSKIIFFSEPYESVGGRPEEIYRELLPPLVRLAQERGCDVVLKLHPFENHGERAKLVAAAVDDTVVGRIRIVGGAISRELLDSAWFGVTVESSTVLDCTRRGVPCFQCEWLVSTPFAYVQQFARFGVGHLLRSAAEIRDVPSILAQWERKSRESLVGEKPLAAETLQQLLSGRGMPVAK